MELAHQILRHALGCAAHFHSTPEAKDRSARPDQSIRKHLQRRNEGRNYPVKRAIQKATEVVVMSAQLYRELTLSALRLVPSYGNSNAICVELDSRRNRI